MRKNLLSAASLLGLSLLAAACGGDPSSPSRPDAPASPDVSGVLVSPLGFAVEGASVVATDGPLAGRSTTTDEGGRFLLAGVQSSTGVTLKFSRAGYQETTWAAVPASQPASNLRIVLWPTPHTEPGSKYTLSLTADPACSGLPADVKTRRYTAALEADAKLMQFTMPLAGADFYPTQRVIWGLAGASEVVKIYVQSWEVAERWLDQGPVVESLGSGRYLAVSGEATMTARTPVQALTATFDGTFSYCAKDAANDVFFQCAVRPVECKSSNHQLTLAPQ